MPTQNLRIATAQLSKGSPQAELGNLHDWSYVTFALPPLATGDWFLSFAAGNPDGSGGMLLFSGIVYQFLLPPDAHLFFSFSGTDAAQYRVDVLFHPLPVGERLLHAATQLIPSLVERLVPRALLRQPAALGKVAYAGQVEKAGRGQVFSNVIELMRRTSLARTAEARFRGRQ